MRLVVVGAFSLDTLQEKVVSSFTEIPMFPRAVETQVGLDQSAPVVPSTSWDDQYSSPMKNVGLPFTQQCLFDRVFLVPPVKDRHVLSVTWQIPSQTDAWRTKPCDYLAHLIGHEAEGSFLASLKSRSWATACCAGVGSEGYEVRD